MSVNTDSMIRNILDRVSRIGYVKPEDIPNIDLYMDQVTTFMEAQLAHSKRYEDDKILTPGRRRRAARPASALSG